MTFPEDDNDLDRALAESFAPSLTDFDTWQRRHPEALACLRPERFAASAKRRRIMNRIVSTAAATVFAACAYFGMAYFGRPTDCSTVLAEVRTQIENAKAITWKCTWFTDVMDKELKTLWVETTSDRYAFRAPGLYRQDLYREGRVTFSRITDNVGLRELRVNHQTKEATLCELTIPQDEPRGPFLAISANRLGDLQWLGRKEIDGRAVNVFRSTEKHNPLKFRGEVPKTGWSTDYWVDVHTKRLVRCQWPGTDIYNPENDPLRNNPPGAKTGWIRQGICWIQHDIVYDVESDDSHFSLEPPKGYALTVVPRPQVTEKDMVEHLGVMAEYYGNTFPDRYDEAARRFDEAVRGRAVPAWSVSGEELDSFEMKSAQDRTPAQNKIVKARQRYIGSGLNLGPFRHFIRDHTVEGTWQYVGKGVKLGDKDRIVCWYKLKGAETYRAVYGDLSVKDVAQNVLPLSVQP
ncbi:MAG: hypothetical protein A2V98_15065 [Planctomycetes bacterium RBG_16_64_12]|nr:MAG: hypothetical protein A2V98_15065 [Planctomycetes bacterium RBG_16_64_12]